MLTLMPVKRHVKGASHGDRKVGGQFAPDPVADDPADAGMSLSRRVWWAAGPAVAAASDVLGSYTEGFSSEPHATEFEQDGYLSTQVVSDILPVNPARQCVVLHKDGGWAWMRQIKASRDDRGDWVGNQGDWVGKGESYATPEEAARAMCRVTRQYLRAIDETLADLGYSADRHDPLGRQPPRHGTDHDFHDTFHDCLYEKLVEGRSEVGAFDEEGQLEWPFYGGKSWQPATSFDYTQACPENEDRYREQKVVERVVDWTDKTGDGVSIDSLMFGIAGLDVSSPEARQERRLVKDALKRATDDNRVHTRRAKGEILWCLGPKP